MAVKKEDVLAYLENANMMEVSELISEIEEKFGVSAAAPVAMAAAPAAGDNAGAEAKTEFEVILKVFPLKKRIRFTITRRAETIPKDNSLTIGLLLAKETVYPAKIHPQVPAAPIKPNHCLDSEGFNTPTVIPQNKTIGKITITSQTM